MASPFMLPSSSASQPLSGMSPSIGGPQQHHHASYTAPYNPQEWGPISASPNIGMGVATPATTPMSAAASRRSDESSLPPPPPPPPYSPPRSGPQAPSHASSSSPVPSSTSPTYAHNQYSTSRPRPSSMIHSQDLPSAAAHANYAPPHPSSSRPVQGSPLVGSSQSRNAYRGTAHSNTRGDYLNSAHPGRTSPEVHNTYYNATGPTPPASRRAASTGDIESRGTHVSPEIGSRPSPGRWEPGMPLPPPPPGPPPGSSPSSRRPTIDHSISSSGGQERTRQPPTSGRSLSAVPPTPLDWVDPDGSTQTPSRQSDRGQSPSANAQASRYESQSSSVGRESSSRTASTKGIRERRIETRLGRTDDVSRSESAATAESTDPSWPADLVLRSPGPGLRRRRTLTKGTPRSARSNPSEGAKSSPSPYGQGTSSTGSFPTPTQQDEPQSGRRQHPPESSQSSVQTPPFSPGREHPKPSPRTGEVPRSVPSKTLPTPPVSSQCEVSPSPTSSPRRPAGAERPISHLLHLPIDASPTPAPLVPKRSSSSLAAERQQQQQQGDATEAREAFRQNAERRYQDYLSRESEATSDVEGLKMFCDFLVSESAIRRRRYDSVWVAGSFAAEDVVSKLFELPPPPPRGEKLNQAESKDVPSENVLTVTQQPASPSLHPPQAQPALKCQPNAEPASWNQYRPTLSPIASMSMSNDEISSRGRAPSRWWESQTGSDSGGAHGSHNSRSRRETKYMGLPREMREAMQFQAAGAIPEEQIDQSSFPSTNPFANYGANEYPPEKVGWHEDGQATQASLSRVPSTGQGKLDISRLVTLPPPYPRHYPAVNNNHPDLSFYRSTVRSVSDLSELSTAKENYELKVKDLRQKYEQRLEDERRSFKTGVNRGIEEGSISYADAAEAEAIRRTEERDQEKELVQAEFDLYQERVLKPMRSILADRVNIVSNCIDELRGKLFDSAQHQNPNQTQEGGDEQPELLEKLTQLKWLFEAREALFREEFDLQTEHSEKYRKLVTLPYHQSKNHDKIRETESFFTRDLQDQKLTFATETLRRFESFLDVIEDNVARGAETQLSAFWDIAPSLLDLLQQIPVDRDLRGFAVRIPQKEYDENPSYYRFPLQYLYSLVSHAEKSTFQFIEAQTDLFCLLHEVKSAHLAAESRCTELQRLKANDGEPASLVQSEMRQTRDEGERALTVDLKEKVGMVEQQWAEALGKVLEDVKRRVQEWLVRQGGWEEME